MPADRLLHKRFQHENVVHYPASWKSRPCSIPKLERLLLVVQNVLLDSGTKRNQPPADFSAHCGEADLQVFRKHAMLEKPEEAEEQEKQVLTLWFIAATWMHSGEAVSRGLSTVATT